MSYHPLKPQLRHFLSLTETKNISKSAQHLGLSQPQLTKSLQALENELNYSLFTRTNRGLMITPKGQAFLEHIQTLQLKWSEISHSTNELPGLFRIGAHPLIAKYRLPKIIQHIQSEFPLIAIQYFEMSSKDVSHALYSGEIDLALAASPPTLNGLIMTEIEKEDICLWSAGANKDTLVVNPQLVQFFRMIKKTKYKKILEIENYEIAKEVALKLHCHTMLPEPAVSGHSSEFKKIKVLETVSIKLLYAEKNRNNVFIQKAKKSLI